MSKKVLRLAALFGDHMVLQQGTRLPVWGWAEPGDRITVSVAGKTARGVAGKDGRWTTRLPALKAGGPHELTVQGKSDTVLLKDVLVGEVWLASGQSNMDWPLNPTANSDQEVAAANRPNMRLFTVTKKAEVEPQEDVGGTWHVCSPVSAETFSAVAYYFGRELHHKLGVPIGLINSSWGGTLAEAWTSREALLANPMLRQMVKNYEKDLLYREQHMEEYRAKLNEGVERAYPADPGNIGFEQGLADPGTDASSWEIMNVPRIWQQAGLNFSGVVWFRKEIDIPAAWAGRDLTLRLAPCDKHDVTYFNNAEVGGLGRERSDAWCTPRVYKVPGHLVKAGRNVIAVRIYSYVYAGGFVGSRDLMQLELSDSTDDASAIPLWGDWRYKVEHNFGIVKPVILQQPLGPGNANSPYSLFRGMIEPLIPFGIRGAIWYQGESNAGRSYEYRTLFATLIRSWRKAWRAGNRSAGPGPAFPFLFVQLANYMPAVDSPGESQWAELREAQTMALKLPRTGMAVAIDIGDAADIHPKNKEDVGKRLALWALARTYGGKKLVHSGPLYDSAKPGKGRIRIGFKHVGGGLLARGGKLTGFAIAGSDRAFVWADARIEGDMVVVSSPAVKKPVAVRYAWADNPQGNLYNQQGLPASPFRTDDWPGLTWPKT